ncbi:MAG: GGDEF domain-containing protein, partial [Pseudomonadota bacterium]
MDFMMKKIAQNVSAFFHVAFFFSKKIDYRTLSRYMLGIHQPHDLEGLLNEVAKCLKNLLNYRLFSFALLENSEVRLWIDPSIYKEPLIKIIKKDLDIKAEIKTHFLHEGKGQFHDMVPFQVSDLLSYGLKNQKYFAKLYMLPGRKMFAYHDELMNIILETFSIALSNLMNIKHLENVAAFDPLTNCYNKREFNRHIERLISNAHRYGNDLSIIMFDMDLFKTVNDTFGHHAGDLVLKEVARTILEEIRKGDFLSRYGGEEFVIILPETKKARAIELAERLRRKIKKLNIRIEEKQHLKVTASFGVASLRKDTDKEALLKEADAFLYKAKAGGRNRVMPQLKLL